MENSAHDFSSRGWNATGELCAPCHTPHHAQDSPLPLWNRRDSTAAFTLYRSDTLDARVEEPLPSSKACLSCHDGTVALNAFGGNVGDVFIEPGPDHLGTDLSNDHPISFKYDTTLAAKDGGLFDPSSTVVPALGGETIREGMLMNDYLECASCHDVHRAKGDSLTSEKLLIVDNDRSALCLTCHNK